ncbi:MAG: hypothetical protein KUG64_10295 [Cycloclasticus sp.]|nr:hypothetical protein [Cycloclasticus sp.]
MKLAACYSFFNSGELLIGSIEQIIDHVDVVIICFQMQSNVGEIMDYDDSQVLREIEEFNDKKIHFLPFSPDTSLNPKVNERAKLQLRIDYAKKLNCTHYFGSACDHYYKPEEFLAAKKKCFELGVDVTLTKMFTYYKHPTMQLDPIEDYLCPFICRIYPDTKVVAENNYEARVDPSVRISPAKSFYTFEQNEIMLHHFSMVRNDIRSKFRNAAAAQNWKHKIDGFVKEYDEAKIGDLISYFKNRKLVEVPDYFNIK